MKPDYWYLTAVAFAVAALVVNIACFFNSSYSPDLGNAALAAAVLILASRLFFRT